MLGGIGGRRRRGRQKMRWLDGITDSMDLSLWTPEVGDGQGGLACCDSWGRKESDTTELNYTFPASASASFLPKKSQGWSPSEWTGWISLQSKGLSSVFSNTTVQKHQLFHSQISTLPCYPRNVAKWSYPTSKVRSSGCSLLEQPWRDTPHPR